MKKATPLNIAIWMLLLAVIARVLMHAVDVKAEKLELYSNFFNFFLLVVGVFFGIRQFKMRSESNTKYGQDVKVGMQVGAMFAVFLAAFIYIFYNYIEPDYFIQLTKMKIREAIEAGYTKEQTMEIASRANSVYSPFSLATMHLVLYMIMSLVYSLAVAFAMRKFPGFKK